MVSFPELVIFLTPKGNMEFSRGSSLKSVHWEDCTLQSSPGRVRLTPKARNWWNWQGVSNAVGLSKNGLVYTHKWPIKVKDDYRIWCSLHSDPINFQATSFPHRGSASPSANPSGFWSGDWKLSCFPLCFCKFQMLFAGCSGLSLVCEVGTSFQQELAMVKLLRKGSVN